MGEINHFSHKQHPLKLIEEWKRVAGKKKGVVHCDGCQEPLSVSSGGGSAYGCFPCGFFLHKTCAEVLTLTFNHPGHPLHPLKLDFLDEDLFWGCDICNNKGLGKGFYYRCPNFMCKFAVCRKCVAIAAANEAAAVALKEEASIKLKHEGHNHPQHSLILQLRPGSFRCDACQTEERGLFYQCDSCDFWIHKACASLSPTINRPHHHHHHLVLTYSLPENFYNFDYYCNFCKKRILQPDWLYHCANCRFFSHIKCVLNASTPRDGTSSVAEDEEYVKQLLHFPMSKAFTDPLKLLPQDEDETSTENYFHWSHPQHPFILINVKPPKGNNNNMPNSRDSDPIEVCHACVQPLSLPYYRCSSKDGCSFSLHKHCFNLPRTLQYRLHPDHLLHLVDTMGDAYYYDCSGCFAQGNTFVYKCETCQFYLDVNCAFLPNTIKHESHNHPLTQVFDPKPLCNACNKWYTGISYACKDNCCDFQLDMYCAVRSPKSLGHRFCKGHEIPLRYPPVENHPEDFYCDICEEEMHPKFPLYYCNKCKNSFHLHCLSQIDWYANVWKEGTKTWSYHRHPLTYVRRNKSTPKYVCSTCNRDMNGRLILECRAPVCNFNICFPCHYDRCDDDD